MGYSESWNTAMAEPCLSLLKKKQVRVAQKAKYKGRAALAHSLLSSRHPELQTVVVRAQTTGRGAAALSGQ